MSERRWWAGMLAWSCALALLVTWPLALDPFGQVIGHPEASVGCHVWVLWWAQHYLAETHCGARGPNRHASAHGVRAATKGIQNRQRVHGDYPNRAEA